MTEIDVFELTLEDADKLDVLFSTCAEAAFKEAQKKQKTETKKKDQRKTYASADLEFPLTEDGINIFLACYQASKFYYPDTQHQKDVAYRLQMELSRFISLNKSDCFELLVPIMAYNMLINNEYNYETVRKRIRADKGEKLQDKRCKWKYVDPFSIHRSNNPPTSKEFREKVEYLRQAIKGTGKQELDHNLCVEQTYAFLRRYKLVMDQQDCARIALFLRDILLNSYRKDRPMDTLIRLYLANQLDGLLIRSSCLETGERRKKRGNLTTNNILSQYVMCCPDYDVNQIIQQAWGVSVETEDTTRPKLDIIIPSNIGKMEFADLYQWITSQFSISEASLTELFDLYFNETTLLEVCELYNAVIKHADNVISDIESTAHTSDRGLSSSLEKLSFNTRRMKSDLGIIKGYWLVEEHCHWSGDRRKRIGTAPLTTNPPVYEKWF